MKGGKKMKASKKTIVVTIMSSLAVLSMFCLNVPMAAAQEKENNYDCITVAAAINSYDLEELAAEMGLDKYELMRLIDEGALFFDIQLCEVIEDTEQATQSKSAGGKPIVLPPLEPLPENPCAGKCGGCPKGRFCHKPPKGGCRCVKKGSLMQK